MSNMSFRRVPGARLRLAVTAVGLAAGMALLTGAASAGTPDDRVPRIVVQYNPGMLASDAGVREVYRRINLAAEKVCVDTGINHFVSDVVLACRRQAVARAVKDIDNPHLAALQASRTKSG